MMDFEEDKAFGLCMDKKTNQRGGAYFDEEASERVGIWIRDCLDEVVENMDKEETRM